ncbi:unnamed protein product, partial [Rotaria socialis]
NEEEPQYASSGSSEASLHIDQQLVLDDNLPEVNSWVSVKIPIASSRLTAASYKAYFGRSRPKVGPVDLWTLMLPLIRAGK